MNIIFVMCNMPDAAHAETVARVLVDEQLAACVNLLPACRSVYHWQGRREEASEVPLLIKTRADAYPALEARLLALHPYEVPEIVALPVSGGLPAYLTWVAQTVISRPGAGNLL